MVMNAHGKKVKAERERERESESVEVSEKHGVGVSRKLKQFAGPKRKLEKSI